MKKLQKIITISTALVLASILLSAQTVMNNPARIPKIPDDEILSARSETVARVPNAKTALAFVRDYGHPADVSWTELKNRVMLCRFTLNNSIHRAFYGIRGRLMFTEFGYPGKQLNRGIYDRVKSVYYNSAIVFVNEIDRPGEENIYVVELNDDQLIRKLRIEGDDMQIIRQFRKD